MRLGEKIGQPQKTEERENPDDGLRSTCHQDFFGSLSIVGVGFVKVPPQFYEKGPFYV